jgi:TrmH family RNA methyltransferase
VFRIPVVVAELGQLRTMGLAVMGSSSHRGSTYSDVDLRQPVALVVGNEAHGLPDDAPVDGWLTIPHSGPVESLNAAMAATLLVFEVARQRRSG